MDSNVMETTETDILIDSYTATILNDNDEQQQQQQQQFEIDDQKPDSYILIIIIIICVVIILILMILIWVLCCRFYRTMTLAGILEQKQKRKIEKIKRKLAKELSTKYRAKDHQSIITISSPPTTTNRRSERKDDEQHYKSSSSSTTTTTTTSASSLTLIPQTTNTTIPLTLNHHHHLHKTIESIRKIKAKPSAKIPVPPLPQNTSLLLSPSKRFESLKSACSVEI
ncbi:hypothetical protein DERF_007865 [Dermatophagoides farinae]|uniref:Uncharacterized protein n=1 Tax=Dermatophagoides farinae TaxID=6954 RepID=A0A922HZ31_DERFA|nr:hypothetical protein DERF_007865 [Dermatophagoides farinae]